MELLPNMHSMSCMKHMIYCLPYTLRGHGMAQPCLSSLRVSCCYSLGCAAEIGTLAQRVEGRAEARPGSSVVQLLCSCPGSHLALQLQAPCSENFRQGLALLRHPHLVSLQIC